MKGLGAKEGRESWGGGGEEGKEVNILRSCDYPT